MASKLFNSVFEMELRILCLLASADGKEISLDGMVALDFITCYSACFQLAFSNLHGSNDYMYGELSNRRSLAEDAIKGLVRRGLVGVTVKQGYLFSITSKGRDYVMKLESQYARDYKMTAKAVLDKYGICSDNELMIMIQNNALRSLKGAN
ncbi:MAG: hypothetical protein IKO03_16515 [Lachnospiraceae bacterium]|nr:hypothetical protein [Lachnospiraceae bacterium]